LGLQVSALITQALAEPVVSIEHETLRYSGELTRDGVAKAKSLLESHPGIHVLAINSGGGRIGDGIDLGMLVHRHGLDVHVTGSMCTSSCANYVFTAGRRKVIEPGAVVVWHGSAIQDGLFDFDNIDMTDIRETLGRDPNWVERLMLRWKFSVDRRRIQRRQVEFFKLIHVDPAVTVFGQRQGCECQWTLSPADMSFFGIQGVHAYPGYGTQDGNAVYADWKLLEVHGAPGSGQS
jgi:hypothetical protein